MYRVARACLAASLSLAALSGCIDRVRVQSFTARPDRSFTYSAHTDTVMTPNDDGTAQQIRREWLAETLEAAGMCNGGYVVDRRRRVIPPQQPAFSVPPPGPDFGNGGEIVYDGRSL